MLVGAGFAGGGVLVRGVGAFIGSGGWLPTLAYTLMALVLIVTASTLDFTEGTRRGGLGGFPARLFQLPLTTGFLVAVPMVCGALAMVGGYLGCVFFLLHPLGHRPPILWPCLYLVAGVSHFQAITWGLASRPQWRLLSLGAGATLLATVWMFFLPEIMAGTLVDWGYTGDTETFMKGMLGVLSLLGPVAYGVARSRVGVQRHGRAEAKYPRPRVDEGRGWRILGRRAADFRTADLALIWHEFRSTGWVLPVAVGIVLLLTGIPTALGAESTRKVTSGVVIGMALTPLLLSMVIGCGLSKPDFWSGGLGLSSFSAVLPISSGRWVCAKLVSAGLSAALACGLVAFALVVWVGWFGDFSILESWELGFRFYYGSIERGLLLCMVPVSGFILTWRFLVSGFAAGLGGRKWLRGGSDALTAMVLALAFAYVVRTGDEETRNILGPYLWRWIPFVPYVGALAVVVKMSVAAWAWGASWRRGMVSARAVGICWLVWILAAGVLGVTGYLACRNTVWLRGIALLGALLSLPLARTGISILELARNRSHA